MATVKMEDANNAEFEEYTEDFEQDEVRLVPRLNKVDASWHATGVYIASIKILWLPYTTHMPCTLA